MRGIVGAQEEGGGDDGDAVAKDALEAARRGLPALVMTAPCAPQSILTYVSPREAELE